MALPKQREIHIPLLREIEVRGGEARPDTELYRAVARHFPHITDADLKEQVASGNNRWEKYINFARLQLVKSGEIDKCVYGVWRLTDRGRERLISGGSLGGKPVVIKDHGVFRGKIVPPPTRHNELKQKMVDIGKELGYGTSTEERRIFY